MIGLLVLQVIACIGAYRTNRFSTSIIRIPVSISTTLLRDASSSNIDGKKVKIDVIFEEDVGTDIAAIPEVAAGTEELSKEEQYKKDKLAEIAEKKAKEVFLQRTTGKYECQACGYVYSEAAGLPKRGIAPGTLFDDIEKFRCPECGANKKYFIPETELVSGFKENQKYGFGGNGMTGEMKGAIIYGGLFLGFLLFLAGYLLE